MMKITFKYKTKNGSKKIECNLGSKEGIKSALLICMTEKGIKKLKGRIKNLDFIYDAGNKLSIVLKDNESKNKVSLNDAIYILNKLLNEDNSGLIRIGNRKKINR